MKREMKPGQKERNKTFYSFGKRKETFQFGHYVEWEETQKKIVEELRLDVLDSARAIGLKVDDQGNISLPTFPFPETTDPELTEEMKKNLFKLWNIE
jgi:hypothetical protein